MAAHLNLSRKLESWKEMSQHSWEASYCLLAIRFSVQISSQEFDQKVFERLSKYLKKQTWLSANFGDIILQLSAVINCISKQIYRKTDFIHIHFPRQVRNHWKSPCNEHRKQYQEYIFLIIYSTSKRQQGREWIFACMYLELYIFREALLLVNIKGIY